MRVRLSKLKRCEKNIEAYKKENFFSTKRRKMYNRINIIKKTRISNGSKIQTNRDHINKFN